MSRPILCDLCGSPILPTDDDGDIMGSGVRHWGAQYTSTTMQTVKQQWQRRRGYVIGAPHVLDAHDDCVRKLFAASKSSKGVVPATLLDTNIPERP